MLTWEDVLNRQDIIGGDLNATEDSVNYRGPISRIEREGNMIVFYTEWTARQEVWVWQNWRNTKLAVNVGYSQPELQHDGTITFEIPFLGVGTIYPKGGIKLDPAAVEGL